MSAKPTKPALTKRAGAEAAQQPRGKSKHGATPTSSKTARVNDAEKAGQRSLIIFPAEVISIQDPDGRGRVKLKLPCHAPHGGDSFEVWARVGAPPREGEAGMSFTPRPRDKVLVAFQESDPELPIVLDAVAFRGGASDITILPGAVSIEWNAKVNAQLSPSVVSKRETELLKRVNTGLSETQASRLKSLDARRREEALTPEEHAELLRLVDESEQLTLGRAEALVELARLRGATVRSLMNDLGLGVLEGG
jgi:hypothetical protein